LNKVVFTKTKQKKKRRAGKGKKQKLEGRSNLRNRLNQKIHLQGDSKGLANGKR